MILSKKIILTVNGISQDSKRYLWNEYSVEKGTRKDVKLQLSNMLSKELILFVYLSGKAMSNKLPPNYREFLKIKLTKC